MMQQQQQGSEGTGSNSNQQDDDNDNDNDNEEVNKIIDIVKKGIEAIGVENYEVSSIHSATYRT